MGERPIWEIARRLQAGEKIGDLKNIRGTGYIAGREETALAESLESDHVKDRRPVVLPSYEEVVADKHAYAAAAKLFHYETNPFNGRPIVQRHGDRAAFFNPAAFPLEDGAGENGRYNGDQVAMDELYDLPFNRVPHPTYGEPIPAYETVKHSVVMMRGCFGGCTFCSITEHEGRVIQNRSSESILREIRALRRQDGFRGTVSDLGGPTANMYRMRCKSDAIESACRRLSCVHPGVCDNLQTDHSELIDVMRKTRAEEGIKHVFIASGVRYDLARSQRDLRLRLAAHHTADSSRRTDRIAARMAR